MAQLILWLAAIGVVLGGLDHLIGNKFGLGKKFQDGFEIMPPLALSMTGIIVVAPILADWLQPLLVPVFKLFGADPAMFATIIANDMGGYPLALGLAESADMGLLAGCIIASMLGCTLTYTIPVGFGMIEKQHQDDMVQGLLIGLLTIPVGGIVGGLVAGFDTVAVLVNNIPIAVMSLLLAGGFKFAPKVVQKIVLVFCAVIRAVGLLGIIVGAFSKLTGVTVPLMKNADTLMNAMAIVAEIVIVLIGILPMLELLMRVLKKPMSLVSRLLKVNIASASGLIYTLANNIPTFSAFKDMNRRGRILNAAWMVTAAAMLGDHLGFTSGVAPAMVMPMLTGRFCAAFGGLLLAMIWTRKMKENE